MNAPTDILQRKDEHLDLAMAQARRARSNAFDALVLEHCALPELALDDVDISVRFLGRHLPAPLLISSMTGGPSRGAAINARLAEAAQTLGVPLAVGSQRVALEGAGDGGIDASLRRRAPDILLLANLGGAQLAQPGGLDAARRCVDMIEADALIVHLNPLQEAVQAGGDRDWRGILAAIGEVAAKLDRPVVVKEVGYGLSASVARRLVEVGAAALDVAGAGGTAWAQIEADRAAQPGDREIGEAFAGWGIPTPLAIAEVRKACPTTPLIGSGGVRHGVDAAKAIRLGADLAGFAGAVLAPALASAEAVVEKLDAYARQLRIACFAAGAGDLAALRSVRLLSHAHPADHL